MLGGDGDVRDDDADVRSLASQVFGFVRLAELYYAGSHGMDIRGPTAGPNHHGEVPYNTSYSRCNFISPSLQATKVLPSR
jgi:hypothetical protein